MLKTKYWKIGNKKNKEVVCILCHNNCTIAEGKKGRCGVRLNENGALFLDAHIASVCVDPIEKKPFFHFLPGTHAFSIGVFGCNFSCKYCQNWEISQISNIRDEVLNRYLRCQDVSPDKIIDDAKKSDCKVIAYTYTEPTIAWEYFEKIGKLAKVKGLKNVFVTNGFMNLDAVNFSWIDGFSIDLKGDESFYEQIVGVKKDAFEIVLKNIKILRQAGKWIEVETLLIPGENNNEKQIRKIAAALASIDKKIPWHILAFYPCYKMMNHKPTTISDIEKAIKIGKEMGLIYIYVGNIIQQKYTFCQKCGKRLITRTNFSVNKDFVKDGKCAFCSEKLDGVWE